MPHSISELYEHSHNYGNGDYDGWNNFRENFINRGFASLYVSDIYGLVLADFFSYYNVEKVALASALHVTARTIHNWILPDAKSIHPRWYDKLERAISYVHHYRTQHGWEEPIRKIELGPEPGETPKTPEQELDALLNAPVLTDLTDSCREGLDQLSEFFDTPTEKLICDALQEWVFVRMCEIYRSMYSQEVEDEKQISVPFGALEANMKAFQDSMREMRLNQLALNECTYADDERNKSLKEQRVAAPFARQMELQAERQRRHIEAAMERSKARVKEAREGVEKALRMMPGEGTFNTFEAHRAYDESIQQAAKENAPEPAPKPAPARPQPDDDIPF